MGIDIHMSIVKDGEYLDKEIFDGRNSEWFANLQGNGWNDVYDTLPVKHGIYERSPKEVFEDEKENSYYGFRYISVKDMFEWLIKYQPWVDAGWATEYQRWNYEFRGMIPEDGFPHYKPDNLDEPYTFMQYVNKYECGLWLYKYLKNRYDKEKRDEYKNIPENEYLIYYFDC